jgi:hypothetical protein
MRWNCLLTWKSLKKSDPTDDRDIDEQSVGELSAEKTRWWVLTAAGRRARGRGADERGADERDVNRRDVNFFETIHLIKWATSHLKNPQAFSSSSQSLSLIRESIRLLDPTGVTTLNRVDVAFRHITTDIDFAAMKSDRRFEPARTQLSGVLYSLLMFFEIDYIIVKWDQVLRA